MKIRQFVKESVIEAPQTEVFEWHLQDGALESLIPPGEPVQVISTPDDLTREGATVKLEITILGPIKINWIAKHQNFIPGKQFQDVQVKGPFKRWIHTHIVQEEDTNRCILRDKIEYTLPFGFIGDFLGNWLVRRKLNQMFEYRHEKTKEELEN